MKNFDTFIIGKGPAGASSAIYLAQAGYTCALSGLDDSALEKAESIDNYYGIKSIGGRELFTVGIEQAKSFGAEEISEETVGISYTGEGFTVTTDKEEYFARTVIIACGAKRKTVKIKGAKELEGKGVSYCAVCDGFLYRGKNVAVIGGGAYALEEAKHLKKIGCKVTVFCDGEEIKADFSDFDLVYGAVSAIEGEERAERITVGEKSYDVSCVFIAKSVAGGADFAATIGLETENGYIVTDKDMMTNCPGLFSAGDATGGFLQVSVAVGEGAKAARGVMNFLKMQS